MSGARSALAVALAGALACAALTLLVFGVGAAATVLAILAPLGVLTALAGTLLVGARERLGGLRRQFVLLGVLGLAQLLAGTALLVAFMFVSGHDAFFSLLAAASTGLLGLLVASMLARRVLRDVAAQEQARRDLLAAVSHDLRTPLTSLRLLSQAIDDEIVDPETRRSYAVQLGTHVRQLGALVDELFELSRLQAREVAFPMGAVDVADLVEEAVSAMGPRAQARQVYLRCELERPLVVDRANPEGLQRVLFNLLENALRHTPPGGEVAVRGRVLRDGVEVEVLDTGEGIPPEERERVFEPFFRGGDRAARTDGRTGLGLAIARAILDAHRARIWLHDIERGTSVRFRLPGGGGAMAPGGSG